MRKILLFLFLTIFALSYYAVADDANGTITAVTITTPGSSDYIYGTFTVSGSYTGNGSSASNISVYANASKTSTAFICADTTVTAHSTTWSCSGSTTAIADDCSGHTIYALYYNGSEGGYDNNTVNGTQTSVKFDNTAPFAPSFTFNNPTIKSTTRDKYSCNSTDACDSSLSYSIRLTSPKSTNLTVKTDSSSYYQGGDTKEQGTYTSYCVITDDATNSNSTSTTFRVSGSLSTEEDDDVGVGGVISNQKTNINVVLMLMIGGFMIIALLVIVGVYFLFSKK